MAVSVSQSDADNLRSRVMAFDSAKTALVNSSSASRISTAAGYVVAKNNLDVAISAAVADPIPPTGGTD